METEASIEFNGGLWSEVKERVRRHEGKKNIVYLCTEGRPTAGIGHRVDESVPIGTSYSDREIEAWFEEDMLIALRGAKSIFSESEWMSIPLRKQGVLVEMVFQMGTTGVGKFHNAISAVKRADWSTAAEEMLSSLWNEQTPARAQTLAALMAG
eukprot:1790535-Amphidinium_carterae.1